ncbi:MAG: hypothetical protein JXA16_00960 [Bacteroidales bacterium]|nr:hypothetical protein [Bacteroidales bacterium]
MAYNNKNKTIIIYIIQEYVLQEQKRGIPVKRLWQNVHNVYPISISTFYSYLAINARQKIKEYNLDIDKLNKIKEHVIETIHNVEITVA